MTRRKSPKALSDDDRRLWAAVAGTVRALPGMIAPSQDAVSTAPSSPTPSAPPRPGHGLRVHAPPATKTLTAKDTRIDAGDPRQARRVARGRTPIDATLDLHGFRQHEAEDQLHRFLLIAQTRGHRTVLVITGKGPPNAAQEPFAEAPRGILRRRFLEWVDQAPVSGMVSGVRQAHIRHGGRGAFYVFLRRDT